MPLGGNIRKLREGKSTGGSKSYEIGIPVEMGLALYDNGITEFYIEWHNEGVLLRPVLDGDKIDRNAPEWVTNNK